MNINFPVYLDPLGRTAGADPDKHIRDLIEQVLFTSPGERVNRPGFGSGLLRQVFALTDDALAAALQVSVQAALQQWLGELVQIDGVLITANESTVTVTVRYIVRRSQNPQTAEFSRGI